MQLFLDCDGVLADFDTYASSLMGGLNPREFERQKGAKEFWKTIYSTPNFFTNLPPMPDAHELVDAVKHLHPIILTGVPHGDWAQPQKEAWRDIHFPDLPMICCLSRDKFMHQVAGKHNIIVDDWPQHKSVWEDAGGTFIVHTSAKESIARLTEMGVL